MGKANFRNLTTFKVGGEIKHFFKVKKEKELVNAVNFAKNLKLPIFTIGGGSDILASDKKYDGVVIKYTGDKIQFANHDLLVTVTAQAGTIWDDLVKQVVDRGLQGIELLSGIPGTVGAAPIQNIGAYGQELSNIFVDLRAYDINLGKFVTLSKKKCKFGYRDSLFKKRKYWQKYIITKVVLKLKKGGKPEVQYDSIKNRLSENPTLKEVRREVLKIRSEKLDDWRSIPNAGSYFKNPTLTKNEIQKLKEKYPNIKCFKNKNGAYKCFAGWFIEQAGWLGKSHKGAKVSDKHALVITNPGGLATSKEIVELSKKIQNDVYKKFGVKLEPEVQYINF